jgi:hypothetical protein
MTSKERAEKIADTVGINPNWGREKTVEYYMEAIDEAVAEINIDRIRLQQEINCLRMSPCQLPGCIEIRDQMIEAKAREVAG